MKKKQGGQGVELDWLALGKEGKKRGCDTSKNLQWGGGHFHDKNSFACGSFSRNKKKKRNERTW